MHARIALATLAWLAACSPPATTTTIADTTSAAAPAAPSFVINQLGQNDAPIQGCQTMLARAGDAPSAGDVFESGAGDNNVQGFIRIDGALITLDIVSGQSTEQNSTRTFADKAHTTQVVETLTNGVAHEEADSVEQSGTIAVTHNGSTQTLDVKGGTAC